MVPPDVATTRDPGTKASTEELSSADASRVHAYGETFRFTVVDRLGIWLSVRQVLRWAGDPSGKTIGDLGAGYRAQLTGALLDRVALAYVADVSLAPEVVANPKVRAIQGTLPGSLERIPTGSLDLVLCVSVLEHVGDAPGMLREIHRILKPGGRALINVPSWRGKWFLEFSAFKLGMSPASEMDDHKMYYDVRDLWPLLVAAGFRPSRVRCFAHKLSLNTFAVCDKEDQ
ncbi:MAG: class I SAM-dependent methyltransferase [Myxococcaceae bacterium]|nr:MAG: class I SAM-dependent methyltransferase [Myxococcaceae bacterium]